MSFWAYLHAILYHCNGTLSMNLVWAWQDLTTAERVLQINVSHFHWVKVLTGIICQFNFFKIISFSSNSIKTLTFVLRTLLRKTQVLS